MILVDSNIPMYLVGAHHPHKADAQRLLEKLVSERQEGSTYPPLQAPMEWEI